MGSSSDLENCLTFPNCDLRFTDESFNIHAPDRDAAIALKKAFRLLAQHALRMGKEFANIYYPGCAKPIQIPVKMAISNSPESSSYPPRSSTELEKWRQKLVGSDYMRILEFLMEMRQEGNIVIITSNITRDDRGKPTTTENPMMGRDVCHHTSDLLLPSRSSWDASQFTGYNYRLSWRQDFNNYGRLSEEYFSLKRLLERDGYVPNYLYTLYRPDGTHCEYMTSYFLCNNYCGDQVRIGVSRPADWRILTPAPVG